MFAEENIDGLSIIVRNDHGLVIATLSQQIPLPASVEMEEVLATRRALFFAQELGFNNLVLEDDSELVFFAINGDSMLLFELGHIL